MFLAASIPRVAMCCMVDPPTIENASCFHPTMVPHTRLGVQRGGSIPLMPGLHVPIWILGSSVYGAQVATTFGLPYAFASHFAPEALMSALDVYRRYFTPSDQLD